MRSRNLKISDIPQLENSLSSKSNTDHLHDERYSLSSHSHSQVTSSVPGLMSPEDKLKLDLVPVNFRFAARSEVDGLFKDSAITPTIHIVTIRTVSDTLSIAIDNGEPQSLIDGDSFQVHEKITISTSGTVAIGNFEVYSSANPTFSISNYGELVSQGTNLGDSFTANIVGDVELNLVCSEPLA